MSTVTESRGRTYSAEAAGTDGTLRCHVVRQALMHEQRTQCGIFIWNDTDSDAHAIVCLPEAAAGRYRSIVQTLVGPHSDFSTTVLLELGSVGGFPEIHVAVTGADVQFTLAVPPLDGAAPSLADPAYATPRGRAESAALAVPIFAPGMPLAPFAPPAPPSHQPPPDPPPSAVTLVRSWAPVSSPPVAPLATLFLAVLTAVGAFAARPQIDDLHLPAFAAAGTTVTIGYRAAGLGSAAYGVFGPDGSSVAGGPLTIGAGAFGVRFPASAAAQAYLVRVRVSNLLGAAVAENYLRVTPPKPVAAVVPPPAPRRPATPATLPPPEIRSLALDRATAASGETVNVYYDVAAGSGTVALVDPAAQITYGRAALTEAGHTTFTAPHVDDPRTLAVILEAKRGRAVAHSRIAISVTPADTLPPQTDGSPENGSATAPSGGTATTTFGAASTDDGIPVSTGDTSARELSTATPTITAPARVRAGQPIRVDVRGADGGLHVVLLDDSGIAVAQRAVRSGASRILFTAPAVYHTVRYTIGATYPRGAGSETVVRTITITP